jgi:glycosyltransferase involved in cell wall biosynthesis
MDGVDLVVASNRSPGLRRYLQTVLQLIRIRRQSPADVYVLGFRGHEIAWLARWMTRRRPLIIDAMMSPATALDEEGKAGILGKLLAPLARWYEGLMLHRWCDLILTDTELHARHYREYFQLPAGKVLAVPVGAFEADPPEAQTLSSATGFSVLFYGSFLPLHGIDVILQAAERLTNLPVEFRFIGGSMAQAKRLHERCRELGIRRYSHRRWVAWKDLIENEIPSADLCLGGPFGGSPQARRVVTGKTQQCLALGQTTVIGKTAEDHGFRDRENCLLVDQADPEALGSAIEWAFHNQSNLEAIGLRGRQLYASRFSIDVIADRLLPHIKHLAEKTST